MREDNKKINLNNMIALCHIVDEFEGFEKRLITAISGKYNRCFIFQLNDVSKGEFKICSRKAKKFYEKNKSIIDTINNYSNVPTFINLNYDYKGNPRGDLKFFYDYLLNHKEEISKILVLLEKLKELGFHSFEFNEKLDFTKELYTYDGYSYDIVYLDNMGAIPNYKGFINYKTTDSNYKMKIGLSGSNREISEFNREVVLNSLLFDPNRLPEKIDNEHIIDYILNMQKSQEEKSKIIKNSIDLSISVYDLEYQFICSDTIIKRLEGINNKEELTSALSNIKENLEKLKYLSSEYNDSISKEDPLLSKEVLEKEKTLYLKRREWSKLDLD